MSVDHSDLPPALSSHLFLLTIKKVNTNLSAGRQLTTGTDWGGGGGWEWTLPFHGFDSLPPQRVPLCTFLKNPFLVPDPKNFLKAHSAPIYTNCERGTRAEKTQFSKSERKRFFLACFFSKFCLR